MTFSDGRSLTALLLIGVLAAAANLPPQHGHPRSSNHAAVVHRHASLHVGAGAVHGWLGRDDGLIVWIDQSYLSEAPTSVAPADAVLPASTSDAPALVALHACLGGAALRIHGPPGRGSGSRAPPASLLV